MPAARIRHRFHQFGQAMQAGFCQQVVTLLLAKRRENTAMCDTIHERLLLEIRVVVIPLSYLSGEVSLSNNSQALGDLGVLRDIIQAYLAFLPRSGLPARDRERETHLSKGVLYKLADIPQQSVEVRITLTVGEIHSLRSAMQVFITFVKQKVAPSRERDETLADVARLRQCLFDILTQSRAGNPG